LPSDPRAGLRNLRFGCARSAVPTSNNGGNGGQRGERDSNCVRPAAIPCPMANGARTHSARPPAGHPEFRCWLRRVPLELPANRTAWARPSPVCTPPVTTMFGTCFRLTEPRPQKVLHGPALRRHVVPATVLRPPRWCPDHHAHPPCRSPARSYSGRISRWAQHPRTEFCLTSAAELERALTAGADALIAVCCSRKNVAEISLSGSSQTPRLCQIPLVAGQVHHPTRAATLLRPAT